MALTLGRFLVGRAPPISAISPLAFRLDHGSIAGLLKYC